MNDLSYAFRSLRRSPGYAAAAVLTLALGIGANVAVFSLFDALALRRLPVPAAEQLVVIAPTVNIPYPQFVKLQERATPFDALAAIWTIDRSNLTANLGTSAGPRPLIEPGQVRVGLASDNYFRALGVQPAIGRFFAADENRVSGGHALAVISDEYWERRFERTPDILSRTVTLNGITYAIIGVAGRGFSGELVGLPTSVWVPFMMASQVVPELPGGAARFPTRVIGRLKPGMSLQQAQASLQITYQDILTEESDPNPAQSRLDAIAQSKITLLSAERGYSAQRNSLRQPLTILMMAVALLLLVACGNLANLMLSRTAARRQEFAVRRAIGADRWRLIRQTLAESTVVAAAGSVLGVLFAVWAARVVATMAATAPVSLAGQSGAVQLDARLDVATFAVTTLLCVLASIVCGILPAWSSASVAPSAALNAGSIRMTHGGWRFGPTQVLVTAQIALSIVLLIGSGLLLRTVTNLRSQRLGFERGNLLFVWTVPGQTGRQDTAIADLWRTLQERIAGLPGVTLVGASNQGILNGSLFVPGRTGVSYTVDGEPPKPTGNLGTRSFITPGFFKTLGVDLVAGRDFTERDTETSPPVVIINEAMARFYFGDRSPIGRIVRFTGTKNIPVEVIGVVRDYVRSNPRGAPQDEFNTYHPYQDREALNRGQQSRLRSMMIAVRTAGDPVGLVEPIRREIRAIDAEIPILHINTALEQLDDVLAQDRLLAMLSTFFGLSAVLLASVGVFGVLSYGVARRTSEIGVRMAMGATRVGVLGMILRETLRPVAIGIGVGIPLAVAAGRQIGSRLFLVGPSDPATIAVAAALVICVAALAGYLPALRASRIEPMAALRSE